MLSRAITSIIVGVWTSTACAPRPFALETSAPVHQAPVIEVENRNFHRMEVTLEMGGKRFVLGEVPAFAMARFRIPAEASGAAARVALRPAGDVLVYDTRLVRFSGVEDMRVVIGRDARQSTLVVRF